MSAPAAFGYVQARVQARLAGLPREGDWQRLEATRSFSAFLEESRTTALKPWVVGLSGTSDAHDIDRGVRAIFRAEVEAAARWVPDAWRAAVRWVQWLPQLPVLAQGLRAGRAPEWMARDPFLAGLVGVQGELDRAALQAAGLGLLVEAAAEGRDLAEVWIVEWRGRCPSVRRRFRESLDRLAATLLDHQRQFLAAAPDRTWPLRRDLDHRLRHLFHVFLLQPAGLFAYLALVAVELERLRAALVSRALFGAEASR
jgi:hypothetical protein